MTAPSIRLDGKVALVTGGGGGIGRAIAEAYAGLGAKVVVAEIDAKRADDTRGALGVNGLVVTADVRKPGDVDNVVKQITEKFGRLDILVNNVGDFLRINKRLEQYKDEEFDALYDINLRHMFVVTRAALPLMKKSGPGGSIINISTIEAFRGIPMCVVYGAFKAGVTGFTKSMALQLGPDGIRVNAIAPETTESIQVPVGSLIPPERKEHIKRWLPLGRFGTPEDAAGCAVFLASEMSGWVTGVTINLDGGALAAGGFYRAPDGYWTNLPVVVGRGIEIKPAN